MIATSDRHTQFGRALANADVSGKRVSGISVIWPGWSREPFVKIGLSKNIYTRSMHGYRHYMPFDHPGNSFDLVGYMVCHPDLLRKCEARAHALTDDANGWTSPPHDKEWRHWTGPLSPTQSVYTAIANLLAATRTTVDGIWYVFERGTGKILRRGGAHSYLDQASVIPLAPNVTTRAHQQVRKHGMVEVIDGSVVGVNARRLRDSQEPQQLSQLPYTGRNL